MKMWQFELPHFRLPQFFNAVLLSPQLILAVLFYSKISFLHTSNTEYLLVREAAHQGVKFN